MPQFAVLPESGWVPRGQDYRGFVLFAEAPPDEKAKTRLLEGLPKYLRKGIVWRGALLTIRRRDVARYVREKFADGPPAKLSAAQRKELSGPDFDAKALRMAERAMADFGSEEGWHRFHAEVLKHVETMHARAPVTLFVRSVFPEPGLDLNPALELVYTQAKRITELVDDGGHTDIARRFIEELAIHIAAAPAKATGFVPCLAYAFGMDEYAEAAVSVLRTLEPEDRLSVLKTLAAPARIELMLRLDVFPVYVETAGSADMFTEAFHEALMSPETDTLHLVTSAIHYAIHPAARATDPSMLEALLSCLEARKDFVRWAMAIIEGLLPTLEWNPELHARYKKILESSASR